MLNGSALETNRDHSIIFETAPKYCILDSFVDQKGYSISSKGFLSTVVDKMNSMKRQKDRTLKDELLRTVGARYVTGEEWRNNSRKNEEMDPKQKQHPVVDVTGDGSKVRSCKEQYCIGTWNVRSMNQDKLKVVKQEMARVNIYILGISELRWTGMGEFNSDDHYIYYCGQESHRRNGVAIIINKSEKCYTWVQT